MVFLHKIPNCNRVKRVRMIDSGIAVEERKPECYGIAEGMKERQDAADTVVTGWMNDHAHGFDVRDDIVMAEHHTFGRAGRAGRKDNGGGIIGRK